MILGEEEDIGSRRDVIWHSMEKRGVEPE